MPIMPPNSGPLRNAQIEAWALRVIAAIESGRKVEDSRVELKASWPGPDWKTARRIAAHANAARGSTILWIFGVDEENGVCGVNPTDLASWWPQVSSHFDGVEPSIHDLIVTRDSDQILVLELETDRSPYVVLNRNEGPIDREIPWRSGTRTRSAKRSEIISILVPTVLASDVELRGVEVAYKKQKGGGTKPRLELELYISPKTSKRVVIPSHKAICKTIHAGDSDERPVARFWNEGGGLITVTSNGDVVIDGAGPLHAIIDDLGLKIPLEDDTELHVLLKCFTASGNVPITLSAIVTLQISGSRLHWRQAM